MASGNEPQNTEQRRGLTELAAGFLRLFRGRNTAYGSEEGGSVKVEVRDDDFWTWLIEQHLKGAMPLGTYPMIPGRVSDGITWVCYWGCVDIDFEDRNLAINLRKVLAKMGIKAWVEVSRSKGYHVWVFADHWVEAKAMRRMLQFACQVIGYNPKEVNPKAEGFPSTATLGNYVRLPYPGAWVHPDGYGLDGRRTMLDNNLNPMAVTDFVYGATDTATPPDVIRQWADKYQPPVINHVHTTDVDATAQDLSRLLPPLGYHIWKNGPSERGDRSNTLIRLVHIMHESGKLNPSEALCILRDADRRWGKFFDRADGEEQLARIIDRVYGKAT